MKPARALIALSSGLAACAAEPATDPRPGFVIEVIERELHVDAPLDAAVWVDYRAVSYAGHVVEYGIAIAGQPYVAIYAIAPASTRPLQTQIYAAGAAEPTLSLVADDRVLEVYQPGRAPVVVERYLEPSLATVTGEMSALPDDLRPLLDIVLPARPELGVPAFWNNIDAPYDGDDLRGEDGPIGQTTTSGRPLLASWTAPVSLLGALYLQAPCVGRDARYACPCISVDNPVVGVVDTCSQPKE